MKCCANLRARIETGHNHRSEIEVELTRRQSELQFLDETSRKELGVTVAEFGNSGRHLPRSSPGCGTVVSGNQNENRKPRRGQPTAYEEFVEAQQRFDFLSAQRQDLLDSIRDTEKAIP